MPPNYHCHSLHSLGPPNDSSALINNRIKHNLILWPKWLSDRVILWPYIGVAGGSHVGRGHRAAADCSGGRRRARLGRGGGCAGWD
eukprot:scaffold195571_cov34-Prasinocladus_malaysianus.AAC.1